MNINKILTIIIPSRKIDYLLEECIKQIRMLYTDVKILVILDELDKSSYLYDDENIKIIKSENLNMSAKRNQGVKESTTKYIAFLDSDSYPTKNWAERGIHFLENNPNYSAVTGNQFNPPSDNLEQQCLRLIRFSRLFTHKKWCIVIDKNAKEQDCSEFMTSNAIMRTCDYLKINGMNENIYLAEDNEFSYRLTNNGYKIRFIPKVCVYHRESTMYPFFRKIYCMSYYYANTLINGRPAKPINQSIFQLFPLFGIILFSVLIFLVQKSYIFTLPIMILLILINCAITEAKKLEHNKLKGFFIILFSLFIFCAVWVFGSLLGILNIPSKNIQECYKHY